MSGVEAAGELNVDVGRHELQTAHSATSTVMKHIKIGYVTRIESNSREEALTKA